MIHRHYANREAVEDGRPNPGTDKDEGADGTAEIRLCHDFWLPLNGRGAPTGLPHRPAGEAGEDMVRKRAEEVPQGRGPSYAEPTRDIRHERPRHETREYSKDPKGYAKSLVMWQRCVRTGQPGPSDELQCPRSYYKKYWARMFPDGGDERSLLEVTHELEGDGDGDSDDDSIANLTAEETDDILVQAEIEARQFKQNQLEMEIEEFI